MLGLHTRYSEARAVHTAWHWFGAMYKVRTSMNICRQIKMEREKEKHNGSPEIWSSILSENALEFMSLRT